MLSGWLASSRVDWNTRRTPLPAVGRATQSTDIANIFIDLPAQSKGFFDKNSSSTRYSTEKRGRPLKFVCYGDSAQKNGVPIRPNRHAARVSAKFENSGQFRFLLRIRRIKTGLKAMLSRAIEVGSGIVSAYKYTSLASMSKVTIPGQTFTIWLGV